MPQPPANSLADAFQRAKEVATGAADVKPLIQYQRDPIGYMVNELGLKRESLVWSSNPVYATHEWDGDRDPLVCIAEALRDGADVGVESGTGTGKSVEGAGLMLWFLACWHNARVFTFAAKEDQLRKYIWMEARKLLPAFQRRFPTADMTDLCLRIRGGQDDSWAAHGVSVAIRAGEEVAAKAKGMHAEHMLLIYEETQGIESAVIEAGANTATAPHNLRLFLGNPDNQLDALHQACLSPGVVHVRISALDHPNVVTGHEIIPGAISRKSVDIRKLKYGEGDRLYLSQVRGISPAEAADALIKLEWVLDAQKRARELIASTPDLRNLGAPALGVDVANSENGDDAAIAEGYGRLCTKVSAFPCPDANRLGWKVKTMMDADQVMDQHVGVDTVGVGAGCFNELVRLKKYHVRSLNGGASPQFDISAEEEFANLRAQMWWKAREDLRTGEIGLPTDAELATDLISPRLLPPRSGKIVLESKDDIKKRTPTGRSPNKGDAFVYWNFVRDRSPLASGVPPRVGVTHGDPGFRRANSKEEYDPNKISDAENVREPYVPGSMGSIGQGF